MEIHSRDIRIQFSWGCDMVATSYWMTPRMSHTLETTTKLLGNPSSNYGLVGYNVFDRYQGRTKTVLERC